ncbi:methionine ABC transporter permease [uncultured Faecalibaculum sp.]|uniref:methionine ABC transporter permease n=2 Tax=uncultured Faecalibaculum sp. TaxID=1729681 RepID=UPI0026271069|nr:methionine ABC transporter permease [uncultured Faecalibaculum sp.]
MEILTEWMPNVVEYANQFPKAVMDTLIMLFWSGLASIILGLILAMIVVVTRPGGIAPNKWVFWILDKIINLFRAIPFIILVPALAFLSRFVFHTTIGIAGAMVPLIVGTVPFMARQFESAIMEIPEGVVEASISMGMTNWQIITQVYLRENIPGMIRGITITLIALIGQIAIVGAVGAGGLGDMAIRYGNGRRMTDITYVVIILILVIISIIQLIGDRLVAKFTR